VYIEKRFFLPHAKAKVRKRDEEEEVEKKNKLFFNFQQNKKNN